MPKGQYLRTEKNKHSDESKKKISEALKGNKYRLAGERRCGFAARKSQGRNRMSSVKDPRKLSDEDITLQDLKRAKELMERAGDLFTTQEHSSEMGYHYD